MDESNSTVICEVAQAAIAFERQRTGHAPERVSVALEDDTLVITLHGILSPAEKALALSPAGAAEVREFHRQLFAVSADSLRQEIERITGRSVRDAAAEVATAVALVQVFGTATMVLVFLLAEAVPAEPWGGDAEDRS